MNIAGKLFGFVGAVPAEVADQGPRSATECPGFGWWYSLQMAKSYECRRPANNVVSLFAETRRRELPLAA
jgi:hypothetical protein